MNGLDSPVEAFNFIPVISVVSNNLWAWIAVITATLSFWRLRYNKTTAALISLPPSQTPPPPPTTTTTTPRTTTNCKTTTIQQQKQEEDEEVLTRVNSKKFFTVFMEERGEEEDDDDDHVVDDDDDDMMEGGDEVEENESRVVMIKRWGSSNELTVEMRGGDFGWYNYQNRKVIDGSVVRLWDEDGFCGSPLSCRSKRTAAAVVVAAVA